MGLKWCHYKQHEDHNEKSTSKQCYPPSLMRCKCIRMTHILHVIALSMAQQRTCRYERNNRPNYPNFGLTMDLACLLENYVVSKAQGHRLCHDKGPGEVEPSKDPIPIRPSVNGFAIPKDPKDFIFYFFCL